MEIFKTLFQLCWSILGIEITVFDYTFTFRQVLFFSIIAYGAAYVVFKLIGGRSDE